MRTESKHSAIRSRIRIPAWLGFCLFLAIASFFLWEEHAAHLFGALPFALLLLCPLIHLLMHRGHDGDGGAPVERGGRRGREHGQGGFS